MVFARLAAKIVMEDPRPLRLRHPRGSTLSASEFDEVSISSERRPGATAGGGLGSYYKTIKTLNPGSKGRP